MADPVNTAFQTKDYWTIGLGIFASVVSVGGYLINRNNFIRGEDKEQIGLAIIEGDASEDYFYRIVVINTGNVALTIREIRVTFPTTMVEVLRVGKPIYSIFDQGEAITLDKHESKSFDYKLVKHDVDIVFEVVTTRDLVHYKLHRVDDYAKLKAKKVAIDAVSIVQKNIPNYDGLLPLTATIIRHLHDSFMRNPGDDYVFRVSGHEEAAYRYIALKMPKQFELVQTDRSTYLRGRPDFVLNTREEIIKESQKVKNIKTKRAPFSDATRD